jgi:hypothetical protein
MEIQPISYRGRTVAACTRERFFLSDEIEARPPDDPLITFVLAMVLYARDIANGLRTGPYSDDDAVRYARRMLIPAELLERTTLDVDATAAWLTIPADELRAAQGEHQAELIVDWLVPRPAVTRWLGTGL